MAKPRKVAAKKGNSPVSTSNPLPIITTPSKSSQKSSNSGNSKRKTPPSASLSTQATARSKQKTKQQHDNTNSSIPADIRSNNIIIDNNDQYNSDLIATPTVPTFLQVPNAATSQSGLLSPTHNEDLTAETPAPAGVTFRQLAKSAHDKESLCMTIKSFITTDFFPKVKFIYSAKKLAYYDRNEHPNTYCAVITKGCGIPENCDVVQWWEHFAKKEVRRKIAQLRSDRLAALKWQYLSKCKIPLLLLN